MSNFYGFGIPRYICSVFDEMRALDKTRNYASLKGLIEEAQMLANRMEAKLEEYKNFDNAVKHKKKLKIEIQKLEHKRDQLNETMGSESD